MSTPVADVERVKKRHLADSSMSTNTLKNLLQIPR